MRARLPPILLRHLATVYVGRAKSLYISRFSVGALKSLYFIGDLTEAFLCFTPPWLLSRQTFADALGV